LDKTYQNLLELSGYPFPVYISAGTEQQAHNIAAICIPAYQFLRTTLNAEAEIKLLVLAPGDWSAYAVDPAYGMPQFVGIDTLVVAGQNNDMWRNAIPPVETLTPETAQAVRIAYGQPDGSINLVGFFNMVAVHEMAHVFHCQASVHFPRHWLKEFFCNLAMHAYVAVNTPNQLHLLETFPRLVTDSGDAHFLHHTLEDFERLYESFEAQNYIWYECQLLVAAKRVYDAGGIEVLQRLWTTFLGTNAVISDEQLAVCLKNDVHPEVARILSDWPPVKL